MDPGIQANFNQLKGLILGIKNQATESSVPSLAVDFCCDMFDRKNTSVLSGYWNKEGSISWTIRDKKLIQQHPISASGNIGNIISTGASGNLFGSTRTVNGMSTDDFSSLHQLNRYDLTDGTAGLLYSARFTSTNLNSVLDFSVGSPKTGEDVVAQPFGLCFGSLHKILYGLAAKAIAQKGIAPFTINYTISHQILDDFVFFSASTTHPGIEDGVFVSAYDGSPTGGGSSLAGYSPNSTVVHQERITNPYIGPEQVGIALSATVSRSNRQDSGGIPLNFGTNTMKFVVNNNEYSAYINNSLWFTRATDVLIGQDSAGIMVPKMSQMEAIERANYKNIGITRFKVWPIGFPEPPDETGHGVYVDGITKYTDKYHDALGNYNPEA